MISKSTQKTKQQACDILLFPSKLIRYCVSFSLKKLILTFIFQVLTLSVGAITVSNVKQVIFLIALINILEVFLLYLVEN